jgi:hypothetical protein
MNHIRLKLIGARDKETRKGAGTRKVPLPFWVTVLAPFSMPIASFEVAWAYYGGLKVPTRAIVGTFPGGY